MNQPTVIRTPLTDEDVAGLRVGDRVLLNGEIFTARDAAHKRFIECLQKKQILPFGIQGQVIYYVGPTPAMPGRLLGAAGPTTSYRMDAYTPELIVRGLKGMIGKGLRSQAVKDAICRDKAVYFAAIGGAGALISRCILSVEVIAYPELGAEAVRRLEVKDFPLVVVNDVHGGDLYKEGVKSYSQEP
jgi:fumarate hydratase subunit beta